MKGSAEDPKGLIAEAYRIDGITEGDCRTIFLDWALSLPVDGDSAAALTVLMARHGAGAPEHPMTRVMAEGMQAAARPRRRGGWRSRDR